MNVLTIGAITFHGNVFSDLSRDDTFNDFTNTELYGKEELRKRIEWDRFNF